MSKTKAIILVVVLAAITFALSPVLWPSPVGGMQPSASQLPWLMFISAIESVSFGIGVWFLIEGRKLLSAELNVSKKLATWTYVSIIWTLVSWWPHDNFHRANGGMNIQALIYIEYAFHLTLIISAIIIAKFFLKALNQKQS